MQVQAEVQALLPDIAERAVATDNSGRISPEVIAALKDSGFFRLLQPLRYGGFEAHPVEFYRLVRQLAGACGSTGWVASVLGVHPWQVALFDDRVQKELWGDDPDTLVSSSYAPVGRLTREEGGFRLRGHWSFSSGCAHAQWVLLGAAEVDESGKPRDVLTVLVPREDYRIESVWDVTGLRGTESNNIVIDDAFVPDYRVLRNYEWVRLRGPGQNVNDGPLYRMPFASIFTTAVTAPLVGAVEGCYRAYLAAMHDRIRLSLGGARFAEDQYAHVSVARAASEIDATILQLERNISELHDLAAAGAEIPMELRLRTRRDQVRGTERATDAIDSLFKTAGGNSLRRGNPIERNWRDVHAGSLHVANEAERALALFGRGEFGLKMEESMV